VNSRSPDPSQTTGAFSSGLRFSDVYASIVEQRFTGRLTVWAHGPPAVVLFRDGRPCLVMGPGAGADKLGAIMLDRGDLQPQDVADAIEGSRTAVGRIGFGRWLVDYRAVPEGAVSSALAEQTRRRVSRLFGVVGGRWVAQALPHLPSAAGAEIDPRDLVIDALAAHAHWGELAELRRRLAGRMLQLAGSVPDALALGDRVPYRAVLKRLVRPTELSRLEHEAGDTVVTLSVVRALEAFSMLGFGPPVVVGARRQPSVVAAA